MEFRKIPLKFTTFIFRKAFHEDLQITIAINYNQSFRFVLIYYFLGLISSLIALFSDLLPRNRTTFAIYFGGLWICNHLLKKHCRSETSASMVGFIHVSFVAHIGPTVVFVQRSQFLDLAEEQWMLLPSLRYLWDTEHRSSFVIVFPIHNRKRRLTFDNNAHARCIQYRLRFFRRVQPSAIDSSDSIIFLQTLEALFGIHTRRRWIWRCWRC